MLSECLSVRYTEIKHTFILAVHKSIRNVNKSIMCIIVPILNDELANYKTIMNGKAEFCQ